MKMQRVVSFILVAALVAACATHRPPVAAGRITPATDDEAGGAVANLWYVPGRALVCGGAGIIAGLVMTVSLGQSYEDASQIMHGGCSGPWIVRASDIRKAIQ